VAKDGEQLGANRKTVKHWLRLGVVTSGRRATDPIRLTISSSGACVEDRLICAVLYRELKGLGFRSGPPGETGASPPKTRSAEPDGARY
jgi:hypothetical protein